MPSLAVFFTPNGESADLDLAIANESLKTTLQCPKEGKGANTNKKPSRALAVYHRLRVGMSKLRVVSSSKE